MKGRQRPVSWVIAVLGLVMAMAGGFYLGDQHVSAQGPGGGPGRFGGPGGPMGRGRGGPGGPGGPGVLGELMLNRLDLSDAQRDGVKQILDAQRDSQKALGDRAMAAHQALEATILTTPLDEAAIRTHAADVAAVDADMAVARGRVISEVLQVLTADQQTKLATLQAQQKQRMEQRRQDRQNRQPH